MLLAVRPARKARRGRPAEATPRPGPPPEREARSVPAPTSGHVRRYRGVNRPQPRPSPTAGRTRQHWQRPGFAALKQHDRSQLRGFTHQVPLAWRGHTSAPRRAGREVHVCPGPPAMPSPCLLGPPLPDRQALPSNQWHEVGRRSGCSTAGRRHSGWLSVVEQEQCTSYSPACTWPAICRLTGRSFSWAAALPRVHLYPRHRPRGLLLRPASRWPPCRDGVGCFGKSYFWLCH